MVIFEVKLSNFANRIPLNAENIDKRNDTILYDDLFPYLGIGYTASIHGVPEFYVTISNEKLVGGYGKFPVMAFDVDIFVADRKSNKVVEIASYCSETFEGKYIDCKFVKCISKNDDDLRDEIIEEYKLDDLLD